ncbi:MAG: transglycosylase SLT domain-containing protein [Betaproteobacteria bacterium]
MPPISFAVFAYALTLASFAVPAVAQGDTDFLAARSAFDRGDRVRLDMVAPKLSGHVLQPYAAYWQLKLRLDTATDDEVRAFLVRWPQTPLADRLRADWLKALGKRGQWTSFAAEYAPSAGEDVELACYAIQYRRQADGDAALAAAKVLWFANKATPDACEPLFAALIAKGSISVEDRRLRYRMATEAGSVRLAQAIAVDLPPAERITAGEFAQVEKNPAMALAKGDFRWRQQGGRDLALYALERAARSDAAGVRAAWVRERVRLPVADRLYGNARIAFHAARQLNPGALDWFREADGAVLSEAQRAWRTRAALRAGDWPDVLATIGTMPAIEAQDSAWRFWKARALSATGKVGEANALFAELSSEYGFYGLLAAEALGKRLEPKSAPLPPDVEGTAAFAARSGVARAVKLAQLDMRTESQREWFYAVRGLPDDGLLLAAEYARREGLYDRAINTADRTSARHDFGLRFLMPYREQFAAAAKEQGVDVALLFAIARQESRFATDIVSSAGAVGLMQLMPPTARWVAKQLNRADYRPSQISDIAINTQFGAFYLKYWFDRLDRVPALAAAAYNAGPGRAQAWRGTGALEGAIWVETIPFNETRDYVKKVLANAMLYAHLLDQAYVPLSQRLGTVAARGVGADAPPTAVVN